MVQLPAKLSVRTVARTHVPIVLGICICSSSFGSCVSPARLSVSYEVRVPAATAPGAAVHVQVRLVGRIAEQLRLVYLGPPDVARISNAHVIVGQHRFPLVRDTSGARVTWSSRLPAPATSLQVEYDATLDVHEGNDHVGHTSRRFGHVGPDYATFVGRHVFLVPEDVSNVRTVSAKCVPPSGWSAASTWPSTASGSTPAAGRVRLEALVASSWIAGQLSHDSIRCQEATARLVYPSALDSLMSSGGRARLRDGLVAMHSLLGNVAAIDQTLILLPLSTNDGVDIGGAWSAGQSTPAIPLTDRALEEVLLAYAGSYVRFPSRVFTFREASDFWFVDGSERWLAMRSMYSATGRTRPAMRQLLGGQLLHLIGVEGIDPNLSRLYVSGTPPELTAKVLAPTLIEEISLAAERVATDSIPLIELLSAAGKGGSPIDLWQTLSSRLGAALGDSLRARATGTLALTLPASAPLRPLDVTADELSSDDIRAGDFLIAASGDLEGYLENCGCKVNQSGGLARRATALADLRSKAGALLSVDAGGFMAQPERIGDKDSPTGLEQSLFLDLFEGLAYDAVALGSTELASGLEPIAAARRSGIPLVCANIRVRGRPLCSPYVVKSFRGLRVGIVGLFEPPTPGESTPTLDQQLAALEVESPIQAFQRIEPEVRKNADVVLVLGSVSPPLVRQLSELESPPELIVSRRDHGVIRESESISQWDKPGRNRRTSVMYTHSTRYGVDFCRVTPPGKREPQVFSVGQVKLDDRIKESASVVRRLDRFYADVSRMALISGEIRPLELADSATVRGGYAGSATCKGCHSEEFAQWRSTKHATAFKTLLDVHRNYQPRCVVCHVVGLGVNGGFQIGSRDEHLANVQCESCHGSGVKHAQDPTRNAIRRVVPEAICLSCHTPEHSDDFDYTSRLALVVHRSDGRAAIASR